MGQYHYIVNYDKREFLHPHKFGDGLKLMEFGCSAQSTMTALAVLLAASCTPTARGGGDIHPWTGGPGYEGREIAGLTKERGDWLMKNIVGRWAGDRIAIIGDYAEPSDANGLVQREGSPMNEHSGDEPLVVARGSTILRVGKLDTNDEWVDISPLALEAIEMDYYVYSDRHKERVTA